jgi:hypothetical protein
MHRGVLWWELTLTVVAEGHLSLAEANGVFALGDAIELFQLGLVDALHILSVGVVNKAAGNSSLLQRLVWCSLA